jgi:hypothetical protein
MEDPVTFGSTGYLPPWDALPSAVWLELHALERWALTLDGAPARCSRRDCRKSGQCQADIQDPQASCQGKPGAQVEHWITGMWLAHARPLRVVPPENWPAKTGGP